MQRLLDEWLVGGVELLLWCCEVMVCKECLSLTLCLAVAGSGAVTSLLLVLARPRFWRRKSLQRSAVPLCTTFHQSSLARATC